MQHPNYRSISIWLVSLLAAVMVAAPASAVAPEPAFLVKDISPAFGGSQPSHLRNEGSLLYFNIVGGALWQSDGTEAGTVAVNVPGVSNPGDVYAFGSMRIIFGSGSSSGKSIFSYHPTTGVLTPLKENFPLLQSFPRLALGKTDTALYFLVGGTTTELWKTDGTVSGTVLVKTINATSGSASTSDLITIGSAAFFVADDGVNGYELWKTDGTPSGTNLVKEIAPTGDSGATPGNLTALGDTLLFTAGDGVNGRELWVSDGTEAGTSMVSNITPGSGNTFDSNAARGSLATAGGFAYFFTKPNFSNEDLWRSDGTAAGTTLVKDFDPSSFRARLTGTGNRVFFTDSTPSTGPEIWTSDGTDAGTVLVKDINPGIFGSEPTQLANVFGTLIFDVQLAEIWSSDGTEAGTIMVADMQIGLAAALPREFTVAGNFVFFTANSGDNRELWALPVSLFLPYKNYLPLVSS
jgi:ELWxxDGT repeat protein